MGKRKLPEGWKISTLGELVRFERKTGRSAKDGVKRDENNVYRFLKSGEDQTLFTDKYDFDGEFLSIGDGGIANLHYVNGKFGASGHNFVFTTKNESVICCKYLYYHLFFGKNDWGKLYKGIGIKNISRPSLESIIIRFPSTVSEQKRIADELDRQFGAIEEMGKEVGGYEQKLVELQKSQLIKLLSEKSGKRLRLGDFFEIKSGGTPSREVAEYWNNGTITWLKSEVCKNGMVRDDGSHEKITDSGLRNSSAKFIPGDSVLIGLVGATRGKVGYLPFQATLNQNIAGIYPKDTNEFDSKFLFYSLMDHYFREIEGAKKEFSMLNIGQVKNLNLLFPSIYEQRQISRRLDEFFKDTNNIMGHVGGYGGKLSEFRTSILHDVFGGFES